jgi:hypothetical protein
MSTLLASFSPAAFCAASERFPCVFGPIELPRVPLRPKSHRGVLPLIRDLDGGDLGDYDGSGVGVGGGAFSLRRLLLALALLLLTSQQEQSTSVQRLVHPVSWDALVLARTIDQPGK